MQKETPEERARREMAEREMMIHDVEMEVEAVEDELVREVIAMKRSVRSAFAI